MGACSSKASAASVALDRDTSSVTSVDDDVDAGKAESIVASSGGSIDTGIGDCGSPGGKSYAGSMDSVDTGGGDCGSPGTLVSPVLNMLPPPIAVDYDLERQQRLNELDPDETDEEELAKIETLRQHVHGALGITSSDEVPEDLFPLFGKSSLVRFGRAKRWKYKRATKMFVEMLCWYRSYDLPRQMRQWEDVDSESHVGRVFQRYMPMGTFGTDKRGAPVFYCLPDGDIKGLVREIGFEAYERGSLYLIHKTVRSIEDVSLERGRHLLHANVVFDMQDVSLARLLANLKPFARHVKTQDDNMPERLYSCLVIRAPFVFTVAWKLLKPLLATETVEKVSILGRSVDHLAEMQKTVDIAEIPDFLGGEKAGWPHGFGGTIPVGAGMELSERSVKTGSAAAAAAVAAAGGGAGAGAA